MENAENKPKYYNEARNRAAQKYLAANKEQLRIWVNKGEKAVIQAEAAAHDLSMTQYIVQAINEKAGKQIITPAEK